MLLLGGLSKPEFQISIPQAVPEKILTRCTLHAAVVVADPSQNLVHIWILFYTCHTRCQPIENSVYQWSIIYDFRHKLNPFLRPNL